MTFAACLFILINGIASGVTYAICGDERGYGKWPMVFFLVVWSINAGVSFLLGALGASQ